MDGVPVNLHSYFWPTAIVGIGLLAAFKHSHLRRWILAGVNLAFLWLLLRQNVFASNWIVVGVVAGFFAARAYKLARRVLARIESRLDVPSTINCLIPFYKIFTPPIQSSENLSRPSEVPAALAARELVRAARYVVVGLVKSFVLAYAVHAVLLTGFRSEGGFQLLEIVFYFFWLYLGLSGYSDIVQGIGRLAGVVATCESGGWRPTAKKLGTKSGLALITVVVLLVFGAAQFGFSDFTDSTLSSSDSGLAAARLSPAETAELGGRLSGALCVYSETPRQQQRPLGVVFGSSGAAFGISPSQLEASDSNGRRWLNLATEEFGFEGLLGGTELFLRSGLTAEVAVLCVRPAILATDSDGSGELAADTPSNDRNGVAMLDVRTCGRTINNLLCRLRQSLLAGQPFEAVFPPARQPWSPNPLELPDRCSPEACQSQLRQLRDLGWFDTDRYDAPGNQAGDFVKTIRRLRRHRVEVVVVLMPESPALRSRTPAPAMSRFTKVVNAAFPKDPPPVVNLRRRLADSMFADHLRPNARGKRRMTGQLARALPAELEGLADERYRANVLKTPVEAANQISDVIRQADDCYAIEPLGDNNRDGSPEFAVLTHDPAGSYQQVSMHELDTGRLVRQLNIPQGFKAVTLKSVQTDRRDLALLLRGCANGEAEVRIINGSTGATARRLKLGSACRPLDLEVITNVANNTIQIAFLGTRDTDGVSQVIVADLASEETVYRTELPAAFRPHDLEVLPGHGENTSRLVIVGENRADDVAQVLIKPIVAGEVAHMIQLPQRFEPLALEVFPDSRCSEFAVLGVENPSGAVRVYCCDPRIASTSRRIDFYQLNGPRDLQIVAAGNGRSRLAVLGRRAGTPENRVDVRQSDTGELLDRLSFGTTFELHRFTCFDSATDDHRFAVLETHASPAQARIHVRQGGSGNFCRSIPVFCGFSPNVLPAWYDENRVQAHTRLRPAKWHRLDKPEFKSAAAGFKDLGARVFTRHAVWGCEDPWWPSAVPATRDGAPLLAATRVNDGVFLAPGENVVQEFVNEAHQQGTHLIAYYWHQADERMAKVHPEWVTKDFDGKPVKHRVRGVCLDITGEYREVVLARLLELASMGVSGFYFDSAQFPRDGFADGLLRSFVRETGLRPPASRDDDRFLAWLDFKAKKIEETLQYWCDSVRQQFPHVLFVISAERADSMIDRSITTRQAAIGIPKSEYSKASDAQNKFLKQNPDFYRPQRDVQSALGWTLLRDTSGRPPHIWSAGVPNTDHALGYVAALVIHGAVANMDVHEDNLLTAADPAESTPRAGLIAAFELGRKVSPYLARTTPVRYAAIHVSEQARSRLGFKYRRAWRELHAPVLGAFCHFLRARDPVGIVNDAQISDVGLAGYKVLFLPAPYALNPSQTAAVRRFAAAGGLVIVNDKGWRWSDPRRRTDALAALHQRLAGSDSPIRVVGGPTRLHGVAYRSAQASQPLETRLNSTGLVESQNSDCAVQQPSATTTPIRLVVALTNDYSWVQLVKRNRPDPNRVINPPAPAVLAGVQVTWKKGFGFPEAGEGRTLRAFDAVSGESLPIENSAGEYSVTLPEFARMALVVIEAESDRKTICEANADDAVKRH